MVASRFVLGQFNFIAPTIAAAGLEPARPDRAVALVELALGALCRLPVSAAVGARRLSHRLLETPECDLDPAAVRRALLCRPARGLFLPAVRLPRADIGDALFSSTIYGALAVALAVLLAEISKPISGHKVLRWLPALLVLAVPLCYEIDPKVPAFGWWPTGAVLAAVPLAAVAAVRFVRPGLSRARFGLGAGIALATIAATGALLVLAVAPSQPVPAFVGLALSPDPPAPYASALGGNASAELGWYKVSAELPGFVREPVLQGRAALDLDTDPAQEPGRGDRYLPCGFQLAGGPPSAQPPRHDQARSPPPG